MWIPEEDLLWLTEQHQEYNYQKLSYQLEEESAH